MMLLTSIIIKNLDVMDEQIKTIRENLEQISFRIDEEGVKNSKDINEDIEKEETV